MDVAIIMMNKTDHSSFFDGLFSPAGTMNNQIYTGILIRCPARYDHVPDPVLGVLYFLSLLNVPNISMSSGFHHSSVVKRSEMLVAQS